MTIAAASMSRPSAPRWMAIALVASMALNLVVVGAMAANLWRHRLVPDAAANTSPNLLGFASTLPAERRKDVRARTEEQRRIVRPLRRDLREAREELLKVLAADQFDAASYEAAQARLVAADRKAREEVYKLYAEIAQSLTSEERRQYMRWREMRRPRQNLLDDADQQQASDQPAR